MEELETRTPSASKLSVTQPAKMLPLLNYPFSAFATNHLSLTGFKYELLVCVRKLESPSEFEAMLAQLDSLQKKNKMTETDYQSFRAIILGRSADDTYFHPPQQKPSLIAAHREAADQHATLFYTQKKHSSKKEPLEKDSSKNYSKENLLIPEKKPSIDLRILSAIFVILILLLGEFFYLSWQKKQPTSETITPNTPAIKIVAENSKTADIQNIPINRNNNKNILPDEENFPIEKLWEKLQYSIDQQYIEPENSQGSAHFIFNQMLKKESQHPLIQRARIQLASAYLNLSKQARETNDWTQAEHYSQQAILVRNPEIFLPSENTGPNSR